MSSLFHGVLIINKPTGWTSHDVVAKIRGLLKEKQIGHLGTLDPLATGVLPLAIGNATRLVEFASYPKEYVTTCLLGKTTDSCDITGNLLSEKPTEGLLPDLVRQEAQGLKGIAEQVPPMVSAVKKDGEKLYVLARKGIEVERKARPVRIENIEVLDISLPKITFRVACSAGTYVRVLCETLGERLGVGGCMEALERTRVGPFSIRDSFNLEEMKKKVEQGDVSGMVLPAGQLVSHLPGVELEGKALAQLCQGQKVKSPLVQQGLYRVLDAKGGLCAIAEGLPDGVLRPKKVFGLEGIH